MKKYSLKDISIKQKLILIILSISVLALLLACLSFILFDQIRFKKKMVQEMEIIADIIGNNCEAALLFSIKMDAQETISSLKAHKHIVTASVYDTSNQEFARYLKPDLNPDEMDQIYRQAMQKFGYSLPSPANSTLLPFSMDKKNIHFFFQGYLMLFHPIILDNEKIGVVYLQSNTEELSQRFHQFIQIIGIILIGTLLIILLLIARFQRLISGPILHLTQTARAVTNKKDYSIRAVKKYNDEIGFLIDNFNNMLTLIEDRDTALSHISDEVQKKAGQLKKELRQRKRVEKEIKGSLNEKEILLQEIHHRVKNNLQIISSLLNLQIKNIKEESTLALFRDCHNRVRTMALIHEQLYQSHDLTKIDFEEYTKNLTRHLFSIYHKTINHVILKIVIKDISFNIDTAIPCGLVINELISNSLKYAFPENRRGQITITLKKSSDSKTKGKKQGYDLIVSDNGIGLPNNLNYRTVESLGLKLVNILVKQLNGSIKLSRKQGTSFKITFQES